MDKTMEDAFEAIGSRIGRAEASIGELRKSVDRINVKLIGMDAKIEDQGAKLDAILAALKAKAD